MPVEVSVRATADLKAIADFIGADQSIAAAEWFAGLIAELESLATFPDRGAPVTEHLGYRQIFSETSLTSIASSIVYTSNAGLCSSSVFVTEHVIDKKHPSTQNLSKCNVHTRNCFRRCRHISIF